jgi:hypothetical protein
LRSLNVLLYEAKKRDRADENGIRNHKGSMVMNEKEFEDIIRHHFFWVIIKDIFLAA